MGMQKSNIVSRLRKNGRALWIVGWTIICFFAARSFIDPWYQTWSYSAPLVIVVWITGVLLAWTKKTGETLGVLGLGFILITIATPSGIGPWILLENNTDVPVEIVINEMGTSRYLKVELSPRSDKKVMFSKEDTYSIPKGNPDGWKGIVISYICKSDQFQLSGIETLHEPADSNVVGEIIIEPTGKTPVPTPKKVSKNQ